MNNSGRSDISLNNDIDDLILKFNDLVKIISDAINFTVSSNIIKEDGFIFVDVWRDHQYQLIRTVCKRHKPSEFKVELAKICDELLGVIDKNELQAQKLRFQSYCISVNSKSQLQSNDHIDFGNIQALKFNIEDIAHSLSNLCRFNGHTSEFYSVAQHSVLVSYIVPPEHALAALLHDAAEAYCGDVVSPLKALLPVYQAIHNDIERTIFLQLGLEYPAPACVRDADIVALATEVRDLMPNNPALWHNISDIEPHHEIIKPWTPETAKNCFMQRYFDLQSKNIQQAV